MLTGSAEGLASTIIMTVGLSESISRWLLDHDWNHLRFHGVPQYTAHNFHMALFILPVAIVISLIATLFIKETFCKVQS